MFSMLKKLDNSSRFSNINYIKEDDINIYFGIKMDEKFRLIKITLEAFKIYGFLCFCSLYDENKTEYPNACQVSNKRIVESCLRDSYPESSESYLKNKTIKAIEELCDLCLIEKIADMVGGAYQANIYRLRPKSEWLLKPDKSYRYNVRSKKQGVVSATEHPIVSPRDYLDSTNDGGGFSQRLPIDDSENHVDVEVVEVVSPADYPSMDELRIRFLPQTTPEIQETETTPTEFETHTQSTVDDDDDNDFGYPQKVVNIYKSFDSVKLPHGEGETTVLQLNTKELRVVLIEDLRPIGKGRPFDHATETVVKCVELDNSPQITYQPGKKTVELTTKQKLSSLLQNFTNLSENVLNDYPEDDTADESEKVENSSVYNNNSFINYININPNKEIKEKEEEKSFINISDLEYINSAHTHTSAHTHEGGEQEDGQGEIEKKTQPRKGYLNQNNLLRLAVIFNQHKPKHWPPLKIAPHQRRQLESYLHDFNYLESGIDGVFKDIEDALEWCKIQSYWEANKGGIHSLLYKDNFMLWSQKYQEHISPTLNATLDTSDEMFNGDKESAQIIDDFQIAPPYPFPEALKPGAKKEKPESKIPKYLQEEMARMKEEIYRNSESFRRDERLKKYAIADALEAEKQSA